MFVVSFQMSCWVSYSDGKYLTVSTCVGDGTEDISCRMEETSLLHDKSTTGSFSKAEAASFHERLKIHFIGFLVYPAVFLKNPNFSLKMGKVPPIKDVAVTGDFLLDTEFQVKLFYK